MQYLGLDCSRMKCIARIEVVPENRAMKNIWGIISMISKVSMISNGLLEEWGRHHVNTARTKVIRY